MPQAWGLSPQEEIKLGKSVMAELRPLGLTRAACLDQVGAALAAQVKRKELPWNFWVVENAKDLNALAAPGGFVFLTRPYYKLLNDDELAFVVGHEMTHIDKRHYELERKRVQKAQLGSLLLDILIGSSGARRGWGTAVDLGSTAYYTRYSRKLEREADIGGFHLAQAAGYDARAAVTALSKLGEGKEPPKFIADIFATHPLLSSRKERLEVLGESASATAAADKSESGEPSSPKATKAEGGAPQGEKAAPPRSASSGQARTPCPRHQEAPLPAAAGPALAISLRLEGEDGERWRNPWRKDVVAILSQELERTGQFQVKGTAFVHSDAYQRKAPELEVLRNRFGVERLLVVTVKSLESADATSRSGEASSLRSTSSAKAATTAGENPPETKPALEAARPVSTKVELGARLLGPGAQEAELPSISLQESGKDYLPLGRERLWPDTTLAETVRKAAAQLAGEAAKAAAGEKVPG